MMHGPQRPVHTPFPSYSPHSSLMLQSRKKEQQRRRSSNHASAPRIQQFYSNPQNYAALYAMGHNNGSNNNSNNNNNTSSAVTSVSTPPSSAPSHLTSLQKQSDPASPATIATTISSQHSTPSPSPARVAIMPDSSTADGFSLFDDAPYMAQDMSSKGGPSNPQDAFSNEGHASPSHYSSGNISIMVPQYADIYGNYSSQQHHQQQQPQQAAQQTQAPQQASIMSAQFPQYAGSMYQNEDDIPELSPNPKRARFPSSARLSVSSVDTYNRQPTTPIHTPDHSNDNTSANLRPNPIPKLGRTYSDAVQDELYNPDLIAGEYSTVGTTAPTATTNGMTQYPQMYQPQQQQQQQHHQTSPTITSPHARGNSPFRATSPYNPSMNFVGLEAFGPSMGQQQQQQQQQHQQPRNRRGSELSMVSTGKSQHQQQQPQQLGTPKTISPKDALLEYSSPEGDVSQMNFFGLPSDSSRNTSRENSDLEEVSRGMSVSSRRESSFSDSMSNYTTGAAGAAPYLQGYPVAQSARRYSDYSASGHIIEKPLNTRADTGAYTCTYSGCGQRFNTSGKLQKHRREAHRKTTPTANSVSTAAAIASRNAQPGPHRCMRPNPSTGKPCNTVFSRPYDLTRHEDTIHNSHKEKVRCEICTDEKTFSRPDALVRHRRVKHGIH